MRWPLPRLCGVLLVGAGLVAAGAGMSGQTSSSGWKLVVLGVAQDGGMPHLRCTEPPCSEVRAGHRPAEKVSSIGLINRDSSAAYLFDATPDFREQVHALTGGRVPDGIFLTHAHIGHYTGLLYLGKESIAAREAPVYATRRMADYLSANGPWSLLVKDRHIVLNVIEPDRPTVLAGGVRVTAMTVPHREEFTDTVGYLIEGPRRKALFIPDIDQWDRWDRSIRELADRVDLALLDGTFGSPQDAGARDMSQIPHPLISTTRERLKGTRAALWFIHVNHRNTERDRAADLAREGMEFEM
ncbi:MAG: MBL fold metallo-hydrolase [Acidobacteria bacterium]|nr:MBL fold metallo-hydrolase [Acidobacteriota bacterium]